MMGKASPRSRGGVLAHGEAGTPPRLGVPAGAGSLGTAMGGGSTPAGAGGAAQG